MGFRPNGIRESCERRGDMLETRLIVSGHARGADTLAERFAAETGIYMLHGS